MSKAKTSNPPNSNNIIMDARGFSPRLKQAVESLGLSVKQAAIMLAEKHGLKDRTVESHIHGTRLPRTTAFKAVAEAYADALGVSSEWLISGAGASGLGVNQLIKNRNVSPSQKRKIKTVFRARPAHMGSLPFQKIGDKGMRSFPLPDAYVEGDGTFLWEVPQGDLAMMGGEYDFAPGKILIVTPLGQEDLLPGHIILCKPQGFAEWTARLYKGNLPYSRAKSFKLASPNPLYEEIKVQAATCEVCGRVRYSINQW
jgi:SOS-response transcriptional repressor LexA